MEVRVASAAVDGALELTEENVEMVLDEVRTASFLNPTTCSILWQSALGSDRLCICAGVR